MAPQATATELAPADTTTTTTTKLEEGEQEATVDQALSTLLDVKETNAAPAESEPAAAQEDTDGNNNDKDLVKESDAASTTKSEDSSPPEAAPTTGKLKRGLFASFRKKSEKKVNFKSDNKKASDAKKVEPIAEESTEENKEKSPEEEVAVEADAATADKTVSDAEGEALEKATTMSVATEDSATVNMTNLVSALAFDDNATVMSSPTVVLTKADDEEDEKEADADDLATVVSAPPSPATSDDTKTEEPMTGKDASENPVPSRASPAKTKSRRGFFAAFRRRSIRKQKKIETVEEPKVEEPVEKEEAETAPAPEVEERALDVSADVEPEVEEKPAEEASREIEVPEVPVHKSSWLTRTKFFQNACKSAFELVDDDKSGDVDEKELYAGILLIHLKLGMYVGQAACRPLGRDRCQAMFRDFDKEKSGALSMEEFSQVMMVLFSNVLTRVVVQWTMTLFVVPMLAQKLLDTIYAGMDYSWDIIVNLDEHNEIANKIELTIEAGMQFVADNTPPTVAEYWESMNTLLARVPDEVWNSVPLMILCTLFAIFIVPNVIIQVDNIFQRISDAEQASKDEAVDEKADLPVSPEEKEEAPPAKETEAAATTDKEEVPPAKETAAAATTDKKEEAPPAKEAAAAATTEKEEAKPVTN